MVRKRTQKGSGFLNTIKGLFRTRKVAPIPSRTINVKDESYKDALRRDYVFFYSKLHGQEPSKDVRFVTPQQEAEVRRVLLEADQRGMSVDQIVRDIFHADPVAFQDEFSDWESYMPDKYLNKGTPYERLAFPVAKTIGRFIATIKSSQKNIGYTSNFMVHQCEIPNRDRVVTTLSDDFCFTLLTPRNRADFEEAKGTIYPVSFLVVKPEFYPKGTISGGPIALSAKRLPVLSFLLEAFRQNGVLEIEPTLRSTLEKEAPELLSYATQDPIVILTPNYLGDPSTTKERFAIVNPTAFKRGRNVLNFKAVKSSPMIQDLFAKRAVYILDAKSMFELRDRASQLWLANFGSANRSVYGTLSPQEKLAFCFLQYKLFEELYSLNRDARNGNNTKTVMRKTMNAAQKAKNQVFGTDYERGGNPYDLAENFKEDDVENLRQLVQIQKDLLGTATIQTPRDVTHLLSKFDMRLAKTPGPVVKNYFGPSTVNLGSNVKSLATRKQRVKQMLSPQNIKTQRNELVKRYQTAVGSRIKTSILPRFLQTKKQRIANKKLYLNRIQAIQDELRAFNEEHGIKTSTGYGYKF